MPYIGTSPSNGVRRVFDYTATAGQDTFQSTDNNGQSLVYTDSAYIDVYQNGILLLPSDYVATSGTTVVLDVAAALEDTVQIVAYDVFSVADTVSASDGGSFAGNVGVGGTLSATGGVTINGTTPTLTIGDAGAEDAKIVFDGNAQDYHIGLDDSADSLIIGKGSALGTTTSMAFDANGIITKPLQPAFLAKPANNDQTNLTLNTSTAVAFGTVIFDNNSDFASNEFTAPVTGRYHLNFHIRLDNIDDATQYTIILLVTSNRTLQFIHGNSGYDADVNYMSIQGSHLVDMDAGDTAGVLVSLPSLGAAQADLHAESHFSGYLVA